MGRLAAINRSSGGVPKLPVDECRIGRNGLEGDRQRDLRFHGGPDRAVCLYSLERIRALQAEGHPIAVGSIGENLTFAGIEWTALSPGQRIRVGEACVELTRYAHPCSNIAPYFLDSDFARVSQKLHPGWARFYARVVQEGVVRVGDLVEALPAAVSA
jgi:MOSC domain-containing protein YiiM